MRIGVDWRVLFFTFVLSVLSGLLLGAAPAWAASRPLLASALKGEDALARPGRCWTLRNFLTVAQIAMSVILLSMTGLFLRSLQSAASIDIGFRPQGLLMMAVDPGLHGYSQQRTVDFLRQLRERTSACPAWSPRCAPTIRRCPWLAAPRTCTRTARPTPRLRPQRRSLHGYVRLLDAMGIPLLPAATSAAKRLRDQGPPSSTAPSSNASGGANPIGRHVADGKVTYEIIGVSGNIKSRTLGEETHAVLFRSLDQNIADEPSFLGYTLIVRTAGDPAAMKEAVRRQIHALDPTMAIFNEETMEEHIRAAFFLPRMAATLFGVFGGIGLVLAAVGLYGVMSYAVSRRTREIGIRMAMGAQPGTVERLVLRQGLVLTLIAVAIGWPAGMDVSQTGC